MADNEAKFSQYTNDQGFVEDFKKTQKIVSTEQFQEARDRHLKNEAPPSEQDKVGGCARTALVAQFNELNQSLSSAKNNQERYIIESKIESTVRTYYREYQVRSLSGTGNLSSKMENVVDEVINELAMASPGHTVNLNTGCEHHIFLASFIKNNKGQADARFFNTCDGLGAERHVGIDINGKIFYFPYCSSSLDIQSKEFREQIKAVLFGMHSRHGKDTIDYIYNLFPADQDQVKTTAMPPSEEQTIENCSTRANQLGMEALEQNIKDELAAAKNAWKRLMALPGPYQESWSLGIPGVSDSPARQKQWEQHLKNKDIIDSLAKSTEDRIAYKKLLGLKVYMEYVRVDGKFPDIQLETIRGKDSDGTVALDGLHDAEMLIRKGHSVDDLLAAASKIEAEANILENDARTKGYLKHGILIEEAMADRYREYNKSRQLKLKAKQYRTMAEELRKSPDLTKEKGMTSSEKIRYSYHVTNKIQGQPISFLEKQIKKIENSLKNLKGNRLEEQQIRLDTYKKQLKELEKQQKQADLKQDNTNNGPAADDSVHEDNDQSNSNKKFREKDVDPSQGSDDAEKVELLSELKELKEKLEKTTKANSKKADNKKECWDQAFSNADQGKIITLLNNASEKLATPKEMLLLLQNLVHLNMLQMPFSDMQPALEKCEQCSDPGIQQTARFNLITAAHRDGEVCYAKDKCAEYFGKCKADDKMTLREKAEKEHAQAAQEKATRRENDSHVDALMLLLNWGIWAAGEVDPQTKETGRKISALLNSAVGDILAASLKHISGGSSFFNSLNKGWGYWICRTLTSIIGLQNLAGKQIIKDKKIIAAINLVTNMISRYSACALNLNIYNAKAFKAVFNHLSDAEKVGKAMAGNVFAVVGGVGLAANVIGGLFDAYEAANDFREVEQYENATYHYTKTGVKIVATAAGVAGTMGFMYCASSIIQKRVREAAAAAWFPWAAGAIAVGGTLYALKSWDEQSRQSAVNAIKRNGDLHFKKGLLEKNDRYVGMKAIEEVKRGIQKYYDALLRAGDDEHSAQAAKYLTHIMWNVVLNEPKVKKGYDGAVEFVKALYANRETKLKVLVDLVPELRFEETCLKLHKERCAQKLLDYCDDKLKLKADHVLSLEYRAKALFMLKRFKDAYSALEKAFANPEASSYQFYPLLVSSASNSDQIKKAKEYAEKWLKVTEDRLKAATEDGAKHFWRGEKAKVQIKQYDIEAKLAKAKNNIPTATSQLQQGLALAKAQLDSAANDDETEYWQDRVTSIEDLIARVEAAIFVQDTVEELTDAQSAYAEQAGASSDSGLHAPATFFVQRSDPFAAGLQTDPSYQQIAMDCH